MRSAKQLTTLSTSMIPTKNFYENRLLYSLLQAQTEESVVNQIVEEYTQLRLKSCLLNSEFAKEMQTDNAHIFLKVLREKVIEELGLSKPPEIVDIAHTAFADRVINSSQYDLEAPYNLKNINN